MRKTFHLKLLGYQTIAPNVRQYACKASEDFSYIPGQFITLFIPWNTEILKRSYSLAAAPQSDGVLEFAVSFVPSGRASSVLFQWQIGASLEAMGPFGRLVLPEESRKRYIFIATGTGVTPYRAMLPQLIQRLKAENSHAVLLLGVRTQEECLYYAEFAEVARLNPHFSFYALISRETIEPALHYRSGHVQSIFPHLNLSPSEDLIYLCGNPAMIDEAFAQFHAMGFASKDIRREKYISGS